MFEVEVKVRADREAARERLAELGAERIGERRQVDTYYDAPHRSFAETDEALRIRRETPEGGEPVAKLTYKGPLVEAESKTREEHETAVGDEEALAGALDGLGFEPAAAVEKDRESYRLRGYTVTLDRVDGLGEFLEVEREAEEGSIESVREGAVELLGDLGFDPDEQIRTSYLGLLLERNEE